jgi:hypothetical protein
MKHPLHAPVKFPQAEDVREELEKRLGRLHARQRLLGGSLPLRCGPRRQAVNLPLAPRSRRWSRGSNLKYSLWIYLNNLA